MRLVTSSFTLASSSSSLLLGPTVGSSYHYRPLLQHYRSLYLSSSLLDKKIKVPEQEFQLQPTGRSAAGQAGFGKIYDKKPFKYRCTAGEIYMWCSCGWSHSQPFCDRLCQNEHYKLTMRPVKFIPSETKEYWFCNCKQTSKRPFCDGTHRREDIIAKVRV